MCRLTNIHINPLCISTTCAFKLFHYIHFILQNHPFSLIINMCQHLGQALFVHAFQSFFEIWITFHPQESLRDIKRDVTQTRRLKISGWALNVPLLLGVVLAVALLDPNKAVPGTHWHAWMYLREFLQLALVAASLYFGSRTIREKNNFNYHAIVEVAALFFGIFICMQPALQILVEKGKVLAEHLSPAGFFWATGGLSAFLDNAPTYLVFFKSAQDTTVISATAGVDEMVLRGIALGAVFMGAMTYIGNGPNFMVKAIAEKSGVKMPSFFGYMLYSCTILLPILLLTHWRYFNQEDVSSQAQQVVAAPVSTATVEH